MENKIFLDTIAFKAFINRLHPKHPRVVEAFEEFARLKLSLFTSTLVVAETHDYLFHHISPILAKDFLKYLDASKIVILRPTPKTERQAHNLIQQPTEYNLLFRDALHLALLKNKDISRTLSSSPHFPNHQIKLITA